MVSVHICGGTIGRRGVVISAIVYSGIAVKARQPSSGLYGYPLLPPPPKAWRDNRCAGWDNFWKKAWVRGRVQLLIINLWLKMEHLSLDLRQCRGRWWMDRHVGENQSLLVVALAQDFVLAQEKFVPHAEPGIERGRN